MDTRAELTARMSRPQRHRLLNGYPIAGLMLKTPRPMRFIDAFAHDHARPAIIGVLPHTFCNPTIAGCGFCTFPHEKFSSPQASAATAAVVREIEEAARLVPDLRTRPVPAVYLGGGTANLGRAEDLAALLAALGRVFDLRAAEVTLEGVPVYFTIRGHAMLDALARVPCRQRRISMGVQTFAPEWIARMGRSAFGDATLIAGLVAEAHRRGITTSCDLLFNLPGTGIDHAIADIDAAMAMGFDQICVYNLVLGPGMKTPWATDPSLLEAMPANEVACATWFAVRDHLMRRGFIQRTLTNFERAEIAASERSFAYERLGFDPLRVDMLGFGPGAISMVAFADSSPVKWSNVATTQEYLGRMDGSMPGDAPVARHFVYGRPDRELLMVTRGFAQCSVDGARFRAAFGVGIAEAAVDLLEVVMAAGLVLPPTDAERYDLSPRGMFYADAVVGFLAHRRIAAMADAAADALGHHGHMGG